MHVTTTTTQRQFDKLITKLILNKSSMWVLQTLKKVFGMAICHHLDTIQINIGCFKHLLFNGTLHL
jgi:hypothetical protein